LAGKVDGFFYKAFILVWGPPSLLLYGYRGALFCDIKLLGHVAVHRPPLMPSSRMSTSISYHNIVNSEHFIDTKCNVQYTHTHTHTHKTTQEYYT